MLDEAEDRGSAATARARLGSRLDGWTLDEVIGSGGTASVYRATGPGGERGAVKVMHPHLVGDPSWSRRLQREAKLLATVHHRGLVRLLHVGVADAGMPFLVMELLEGRSLEALRQETGGSLPVGDVLRHASAVLEVLEHMHARDIVHRDLKPSNVFVTRGGDTRVLDFGIASAGDGAALEDPTTSATRGILGTPAYMAPEQARGRWGDVDPRTDLWAVGATMFTLLTGDLVHVAVTENERLGLAMSRRARSLASVRPNLDHALVAVVDRALSYEREARFQSASAFREALARVSGRPAGARAFVPDATPTVAGTVSLPAARPRRRTSVAFVAGAGALLVGTAAVYLFLTRPVTEASPPVRVARQDEAPKPVPPRNDTDAAREREAAVPARSVVARAEPPPHRPPVRAVLRPARTIDQGARVSAAPDPSTPRSLPPAQSAGIPVASWPERDDLDARTPTGSTRFSADDLMDRRD